MNSSSTIFKSKTMLAIYASGQQEQVVSIDYSGAKLAVVSQMAGVYFNAAGELL